MIDTPAAPARRGGRPRAAGVRRDQLLQIRATPDEAAAIDAKASAAGLTLSDYMRQAAMNALLRRVSRAALDPVTIHHLALLGSNVNQIARVLNVSGDIERAARMDELAGEIRTLLDAIRSHVR